jgi:hypothetical protein
LWEGFAKIPPIEGPRMVPIDQTKGITANAFAEHTSVSIEDVEGCTKMKITHVHA